MKVGETWEYTAGGCVKETYRRVIIFEIDKYSDQVLCIPESHENRKGWPRRHGRKFFVEKYSKVYT